MNRFFDSDISFHDCVLRPKMVKMRAVHKLTAISFLFLAWAGAEELPLPTKDWSLDVVPLMPPLPSEGGSFLKPTVSIKPPHVVRPVAPSDGSLTQEQRDLMAQAAQIAAQRAKDQAASIGLKRIVVMKGPLSKKLEKSEMLPGNPDGRSVTLVGIEAPKEVVTGLESFFGVQLTPDNEQKLLDTVRRGLAGSSQQERKVEVLGWWPKEGVMAVGVHPEG